MLFPLKVASDLSSKDCDCIVIVVDNVSGLTGSLSPFKDDIAAYSKVNVSVDTEKTVSVIPCRSHPSNRLVYSNTGPLNRDYDDIRSIYDAAGRGIKSALAAGAKRLVICLGDCVTLPKSEELWASSYANLLFSLVLGALQVLYTPIEVREACPEKSAKVESLTFFDTSAESAQHCHILEALENGRIVARDIGGSDPERMAAPRIVEYIRSVFDGTCVQMNVDHTIDDENYPLMAAVNRGSHNRHTGSVVHLSYTGEGSMKDHEHLLLVGKGITYDTGGADIKAGGHMAGMHRDKCGAAAVAGLFKTLADLKPPGISVIGSMAYVRNSVGSNCYVSDEIITSRAGVRVRVGNTDAEGRMVMSDLVCLQKERALQLPDPSMAHIFTVATLTGHVMRAYGEDYSAVMDNGPARRQHCASKLQVAGDSISDLFEVSTVKREDYCMVAGRNEYEDLIQSNDLPSSATPRGHQFPAAFMARASGLDKHGTDSKIPLKYSHLDVAGSSGPYPGIPTGAPLLAIAARYILPKLSK